MLFNQGPVEPVDLVILAIGVIVAALCAPHLVAGHEHGNALREHQHSREVFHLAIAQLFDVGITRLPLLAAVPAQVLVDAVAIALAVGLVVLVVEGDQVVEREAVVRGDEIDAVDGQPPAGLEDIGAACNHIGHLRYNGFALAVSLVAFDEAAHGIAETPIPFSPAIAGEVAHLVQTGGIPGFGDDLGISQCLRQFNLPDDRRAGHGGAVLVAAQNDGSIKPKPSTINSLTQNSSASTISFSAMGWLPLKVLPHPEKFM